MTPFNSFYSREGSTTRGQWGSWPQFVRNRVPSQSTPFTPFVSKMRFPNGVWVFATLLLMVEDILKMATPHEQKVFIKGRYTLDHG